MAGTRLINPNIQYVDASGTPVVGGKLTTYEAGTTTPLATYTDSGLGTPNTNPIILDNTGYIGEVWMDPDVSYKLVLTTSADVAVWTRDNVLAGGQVGVGNIEADAVTTAKIPDGGITTAKIADDNVTGAKLNTDVADTTTIELSSDTLTVKDGGLTGVKTAAGAGFIYISANDTTEGVLNGKLVAGDNITLTEGSDGADETLTVDTNFRGALVSIDGGDTETLSDGASDQEVTWTEEHYDTDSFADLAGANPERLTVSAADIERVRLKLNIQLTISTSTTSGTIVIKLFKNGALVAGSFYANAQQQGFDGNATSRYFSLESAVLSVAQNDYFSVAISWTDSTGSASLAAAGEATGYAQWFSIEVVE